MNKVSLTVYGDDRTLQTIREALPTEPACDWSKGDARANGRVQLDSGFVVEVAAHVAVLHTGNEDRRDHADKRRPKPFSGLQAVFDLSERVEQVD